jgi:hypothetical protein
MFNWDLLSPRNLVVIVIFSVIALAIFGYFHNPMTTGPALPDRD